MATIPEMTYIQAWEDSLKTGFPHKNFKTKWAREKNHINVSYDDDAGNGDCEEGRRGG